MHAVFVQLRQVLWKRKKKNDIKLNNTTVIGKSVHFKHKIWAENTHNTKIITKMLEEMQNMFFL